MLLMRRAAAVLLLVAAGAVAGSDDAAPAIATAEQFHQALRDGDRAAALDLLDEGLQVFEAGHVERSRDEYAASHLGADIDYLATAKVTLRARQAGVEGDLAWVISESDIAAQRDGKPVASASLETLVLRRQAQRWRIVHIHWSSRSVERKP